MAKLNLSDIVALAKSGYSVSDVKELISLSSSDDTPQEQEEKPKDEKEARTQESGKEPPQEPEPKKSTEAPADASAIDEYKKEIEKLKDQISNLQKENVNRDNSGKDPGKSDEDILDDITRSFM